VCAEQRTESYRETRLGRRWQRDYHRYCYTEGQSKCERATENIIQRGRDEAHTRARARASKQASERKRERERERERDLAGECGPSNAGTSTVLRGHNIGDKQILDGSLEAPNCGSYQAVGVIFARAVSKIRDLFPPASQPVFMYGHVFVCMCVLLLLARAWCREEGLRRVYAGSMQGLCRVYAGSMQGSET
jgi:hypothetical protein